MSWSWLSFGIGLTIGGCLGLILAAILGARHRSGERPEYLRVFPPEGEK